jgi:UDP-2,3-diacylglucosamine hydrolase
VSGTRVLLMHGDTLCTDDHAYQRYRRLVHRPGVQAAYLALPPALRSGIAAWARRRSIAANAGKPAAIMDVSPAAVEAVLREHDYPRLIHGHTHRPGKHVHLVDGRVCERWVLNDWYACGGYLRCDAPGCELVAM